MPASCNAKRLAKDQGTGLKYASRPPRWKTCVKRFKKKSMARRRSCGRRVFPWPDSLHVSRDGLLPETKYYFESLAKASETGTAENSEYFFRVAMSGERVDVLCWHHHFAPSSKRTNSPAERTVPYLQVPSAPFRRRSWANTYGMTLNAHFSLVQKYSLRRHQTTSQC